MTQYRWAAPDEITWINNQYSSIGFMPSKLKGERIAIAEVDGQRAGIARFVDIDEASTELGGLYVIPDYRNRGIARGLVEFLLKNREKNKRIYCIPFSHLAAFYEDFGFGPPADIASVPEGVLNKQRWCDTTYPHQTYVYVLRES